MRGFPSHGLRRRRRSREGGGRLLCERYRIFCGAAVAASMRFIISSSEQRSMSRLSLGTAPALAVVIKMKKAPGRQGKEKEGAL